MLCPVEHGVCWETDLYLVVRNKIMDCNESKEGHVLSALIEYPWDSMDSMRVFSEEVAVGLSSEG